MSIVVPVRMTTPKAFPLQLEVKPAVNIPAWAIAAQAARWNAKSRSYLDQS